ncbi:vomeronasal type-1 receptor A11-like, partial [Heterocephalus glaber]|uniref:Vomeronasal type-1 receptor n=1 Tax=Heterocephalus glaber TaxID=10181 RepID=A0AAX6TJN7_HETGA
VIGVSGNAFLLFHIIFFLGHRPRFTDLTIGLLALNHLVMLLTKGFITADIFTSQASSHLIVSIAATVNLTRDHLMYVSESCSLLPMSYISRQIFSTLLTFWEVFFMWLMSLSGGYIVILLCRHKKQSQQLCRIKLSPKASPGQRATRTILLLMCFFVVMTSLDIMFYSRIVLNNPIFYCIQILMAHSYAVVSPLVFITTEKFINNFLRFMCGRQ